MPRESPKYRKCSLFIVLLVFLAFLPPSQELSFGWGGGGDDSKSKDAAASDASANLRKVNKKQTLQKKFKFHKIERIELEDDDEAVQSNDGEDATTENLGGEEIDDNATNEKDNMNGDDDEYEQNDSQRDRADSINSKNNDDEEEEFQYKRARTAQKTLKKNKNVDDVASKEKSKSFFSGIFGNLFGGGGSSSGKESLKEEPKKSNGIIDWLMWLGEKTGRLKAAPKSVEEEDVSTAATSSGENWIDYFNRWPFNSLFPIGKPPKPIKMPKTATSTKSTKNRSGGTEENASYENVMSQESFDNLLRTLPSFVINPNEVRDIDCHQQLQIFQRQLRGHKLWTLQSKFLIIHLIILHIII